MEAVATIGAVIALCNSILQLASAIQVLLAGWASVTTEHKTRMDDLKEKIDFYGEQMDKHGVPVDNSMVKTLRRAEKLLQKEKDRVEDLLKIKNSGRCWDRGWWLYAKLTMIMFPQSLEKTIKKVEEEVDKIPVNLKMKVEVDDDFRRWREHKPVSTIIHDNDDLYVPIKESHSQVIEAIEALLLPIKKSSFQCIKPTESLDEAIKVATSSKEESNPKLQVILLHGGVGKGKSTLARSVCSFYGEGGQKGNLFQHVIIEPCDNLNSIPDHSIKQANILRRLSPSSLEETDSEARIAAAFQDFLRMKKILIILDDVADQNFLHKMWEAAQGCKHVKYLVTSQRSDLCCSLTQYSQIIPMGDPNIHEARAILASHVGLEGKIIPSHLKKIADKMIEATEGNPAALASLASNITVGQDKENKTAWKDASRELNNLLDKPVSKILLGQKPKTSFWASMRLCIDSLETSPGLDGARVILSLLYACQGQSIPQEVLRILYSAATKKTSGTLSRSIDELYTRDLLKVKPQTGEYQQESSAWSLRSLVKQYMDWDMAGKVGEEQFRSEIVGEEEIVIEDDAILRESGPKKKLRHVIRALLSDNAIASKRGPVKEKPVSGIEGVESEKTRVVTALCALYFGQNPTNELVACAAKWARTESKLIDLNNTRVCLRRKAMEPIMWLLDEPEADDDIPTGFFRSVRQVFLTYVNEGRLDDANVCVLLKWPEKWPGYPLALLATLRAIAHIFSTEEAPFPIKDDLGFLKVLVDFLESNESVEISIREAASKALLHVSKKAAKNQSTSIDIVANTPRILAVLARSIQNSLASPLRRRHSLVKNTGVTLRNLAYGGGQSMKGTGGRSMDYHPILLQNITGALMNLAAGEESIKDKISDEDGALAGLVQSLSEDLNPGLQENAAGVLKNLALGGQRTRSKILDEDGALAGLVASLSKKHNPGLQTSAVAALRDLAYGGDPFITAIANEKGTIPNLVKALAPSNNPLLQRNAAGALGNLASGKEEIKHKILEEDGALAGLVGSLSKPHDPALQEKAASALCNLAAVGDSDKSRIVIEHGALAALVSSLSMENNSALQQSAAGALLNLTAGGDSIKLKILEEDGALAGLVKSLSKGDNLGLQEKAAGTLSNLALGGELIKLQILKEEGVLGGLVESLSHDNNPMFQENAAGALLNLARGGDLIKNQILSGHGTLVGLVESLSKEQNKGLQRNAVGTLMNLALGGEQIKSKILEEGVALAGLVECLVKDDNTILRENAAGALSGLAAGPESIKLIICNQDGALAGLAKFLSPHYNPVLQEYVASVLWNLACGGDSIKSKIVNEDRVLEGLVKALSQHHNPGLQEIAAGTLENLGRTEDCSIKLKMNNEDGLITGLTKSATEQYNPVLQQEAAEAVKNLKGTTHPSVKAGPNKIKIKYGVAFFFFLFFGFVLLDHYLDFGRAGMALVNVWRRLGQFGQYCNINRLKQIVERIR